MSDPRRIRLRVVHGHLAFARFPVVVGHFDGDAFAAAEKQLDRALGSRLTERRDLGLYPGPTATATVVLSSERRPPGAVVVGLGEPASLSASILRRSLRYGLLAFAAEDVARWRAAEEAKKREKIEATLDIATPLNGNGATKVPPRQLCLSTLLVGSESGMDHTTCVQAFLQAAGEAQEILKYSKLNAEFACLEVIELDESRAIAICGATESLLPPGSTLSQTFQPPKGLERRAGGRRRVTASQDAGWWQPIQITMKDEGRGERSLNFTVAEGLARVDARTIAADLDVVEPLIRKSVRTDTLQGAPTSPGRALFELLWPLQLKDRSGESRHKRLILDEQSARFPWELLDDRRPWIVGNETAGSEDQKPPAVRTGLVRQLLQGKFREHVFEPPRERPQALVIGPLPVEGFPGLPQAQKEANTVAELLGKTHLGRTHSVTRLIDNFTPEQVCQELFAEAWDIIHIAAHGIVDQPLTGADGFVRRKTGVVFGPGMVLGPSLFSKLPVAPSLAFVNCCHLGSVGPADGPVSDAAVDGRSELAATLSVELIRSGVRCVIAAGWAVQDRSARTFAEAFYTAILKGETFGQATLQARRKAYDEEPNGTTWGAYQCYGEPDFRLRRSETETGHKQPPNFVTIAQAILAAEEIRDEVNIGLERDPDRQRDQLEQVEKQVEVQGWKSAELHVALAGAWADLGDLPKAITHHETAIADTGSRFEVRAAERLASLRARRATIAFRRRAGEGDVDAADRDIRAALKMLEGLDAALGKTEERLSLQGGCWKRLAQVQASSEHADEALLTMAERYGEAARLAQQAGSKNLFYPTLMYCSAKIAQALRAGTDVEQEIEESLEDIQSRVAGDPADFWELIMSADASCMLAMLDKQKPPLAEQAYARAWQHVGSPLNLMSVIEHFQFVTDVLASGAPRLDAKRSVIRAWVGELCGRVAKQIGDKWAVRV